MGGQEGLNGGSKKNVIGVRKGSMDARKGRTKVKKGPIESEKEDSMAIRKFYESHGGQEGFNGD